MKKKVNPLTHIAKINSSDGKDCYIFLRKNAEDCFAWYSEDKKGNETALDLEGATAEKAIQTAAHHFKLNDFRPVDCGFRYVLHPRDEHGINAMFHQMVASYGEVARAIDGAYHDEGNGQECYVDFASDEALDLWRQLETEDRL